MVQKDVTRSIQTTRAIQINITTLNNDKGRKIWVEHGHHNCDFMLILKITIFFVFICSVNAFFKYGNN